MLYVLERVGAGVGRAYDLAELLGAARGRGARLGRHAEPCRGIGHRDACDACIFVQQPPRERGVERHAAIVDHAV